MIPCVSGKCIFSALTSRRFRPLPAVAVLRIRSSSGVAGGVVTAISAPLIRLLREQRRRGFPVRLRRLGRQLRDLLLDLFEHSRIPYLAPPVRVHEPATFLSTPAPRLVIGLRVRDVLQLRLLLAAYVTAVLAAPLVAAPRGGRD